jgi:hypothetical protein
VRILGVGSNGSQRILRRTRAIGENSPNLGNERFGIPEPEELVLLCVQEKANWMVD